MVPWPTCLTASESSTTLRRNEEQVMDIALEVGAEDIQSDEEGGITVSHAMEILGQVAQALQRGGIAAGCILKSL
ncbi:MAG: hypothetical protein CM15mP68_0970 [Pseudomonadota bacterium]|nr:MAG: hypothetical protein CM15mP68_0970 [Pseudomonadota bacterium]